MQQGVDIQALKERFLEIYRTHITRDGSQELLRWLEEKSDYFTAPASTKFHEAYEGGLLDHSLTVYDKLHPKAEGRYSEETIALCALMHDVCKTNLYRVSSRNVKNDVTGQWEKVPYYTIEDRLPYGHGEKSVYMLSGFLRLSREEAMAIRWHMGGFDDAAGAGFGNTLRTAFEMYPLAVMLHISDMEAVYLKEPRE